VIIVLGDYEQRKHRENKDTRKGKGMRDVLRRAGYNVVPVDEYRTTASCSGCKRDELDRTEAMM
jgi:hypothetical protein